MISFDFCFKNKQAKNRFLLYREEIRRGQELGNQEKMA